jgi:tetratricopeptide (TPR) repeat protein
LDDTFARFEMLLAEVDAGSANPACDLLLQQLSPDLAHCFRLCAIPHQVDGPILAALLPLAGAEQIKAYAGKLSELALVSVHGATIALHDTARRYLFAKWLESADQEFVEVSKRLCDFFDNLAHGSSGERRELALRSRMFHRIAADEVVGLAELESLFGESRSAGRRSACESLLRLANEYESSMTAEGSGFVTYLWGVLASDREHWIDAESKFEEVITNAALSDQLHMRAFRRLGLVRLKQRRWNEAISTLEAADGLTEMVDSPRHKALILSDLADVYRLAGNRTRSERFLKQAVESAGDDNNPWLMAKIYNSAGNLHRSYNEYAESMSDYRRGLSYLDTMQNSPDRAAILNNIGEVACQVADWRQAKEVFETSLTLSQGLADTRGQARALSNLVRVYWNLGDKPGAFESGQTSTTFYLSLHDDFEAGIVVRRLARLHRADKRIEVAGKHYTVAAEHFRKAGAADELQALEREIRSFQHQRWPLSGIGRVFSRLWGSGAGSH